MRRLSRRRALGAVVVSLAVGAAAPASVLVDSAAAKPKRHCVKFKTVKGKHGNVRRCARYGK